MVFPSPQPDTGWVKSWTLPTGRAGQGAQTFLDTARGEFCLSRRTRGSHTQSACAGGRNLASVVGTKETGPPATQRRLPREAHRAGHTPQLPPGPRALLLLPSEHPTPQASPDPAVLRPLWVSVALGAGLANLQERGQGCSPPLGWASSPQDSSK